MRVHACRHCGEVFPSYSDLRQHLDSHVSGHKCATCGRAFTRRDHLQRHASRCRPKPFTCDVCHSGFTRKWDLDQHKRTVQCGGPPQPGPAPKRRRIVASLNEDPVLAPPVEHAANDELSSAIRDFVHENWGSIRTHVVHGPVQTRYNRRLTSLDTRDLHEQLRVLFEEQTTSFKINCSFAFILKNKTTNRLKYYHSSNNCCGRLLEEPSLITNRDDFDRFLARIQESDILQWAVAQRPNSDWICEMVTNATFFLNRIEDHPIGCVGINLPDYVKNNKAIVGLEKDRYRKTTYNDNLCLFRCLALHLGREAAALYAEYTDTPVRHFAGVTLDELDKVETTFKTNVFVYKLVEIADGKTTAELVRRSMGHYTETMYLNLYEAHFSYIKDIRMYSHSYKCSKCEQALWKSPYHLHRHERTCTEGIKRVYKGGVYHPPSSIFERLDDEGIIVEDVLRYYPYRATFDFECYFDRDNVPADTNTLQWSARHVPLSVSVASNVPGHEDAQCYITNGDSDKLVADMMSHLHAVSDAAFESLKPSYESVLDKLKMLKEEWDSAEEECGLEEAESEANADESKTNPFKKLLDQLFSWLQQLPVIGFNSGKYDLNMIKRSFVPLLIHNNTAERASCFVIKRQNNFMCFSTNKLKFVDICNYLAPGFSYDKYLKAYGCDLQKGHFPYEYMDGIEKLEDRALPPQAAFFSRLKNEGISNDDYARCQAVWRNNQMTTMRDYLVWYNNRDVTPFLDAIAKQAAFYRDRHIDMFKDGISVPGLSLLHLFNDLPNDTYFTVFNRTNSDLHELVKDNIVGGPAIIVHRYHEKNVTRIRGGSEPCRSIVGYDANALYLWALMQDMPTGWYVRRREENGFRPQQAQPYGQMAVQWLTWEAAKNGCTIRHQVNGREKRIGKLPVDGWCAETRTAYQFHGCYFHGCTNCYEPQETNTLNGKTMATLLEDTKKNTAYLRRHVHVVEMWECEWKRERDPPPRQKWQMTQNEILAAVIDGTLFGMIECDIHVPPELRPYFSEMQPIFKNANVSRDDIGPYMRQYAEENDIMSTPRRMLVGSFHGIKLLLATPLLRWYLAHGLVVDRVYQIVEYSPKPCFQNFGDSVSAARRAGDADPDKSIIADTMKLLGNSAYGKTVTNVDRHRKVTYCTEVGTSLSLLVGNKRFRQLDVVTDDAYEVTSSKARVTYDLPLHIGFFVYQYAKLRMLQFYYDFVARYVERPMFQYCEMDTDSAYIALAGDSIDDLVSTDRREHYFRNRSQWLPAECCDDHEEEYVCARIAGRSWTATESCCIARKAFDKRTPGLFKVEWRGNGFIGLCSKTYYCFGATDKYSTKGLSKRHNDIDKDTFLAVLTNRRSGGGVNRGFRVHNSSMMTYVQERAALTYFYPKRKVLADGLSTAPLDL